jgi:hypothetical protein
VGEGGGGSCTPPPTVLCYIIHIYLIYINEHRDCCITDVSVVGGFEEIAL